MTFFFRCILFVFLLCHCVARDWGGGGVNYVRRVHIYFVSNTCSSSSRLRHQKEEGRTLRRADGDPWDWQFTAEDIASPRHAHRRTLFVGLGKETGLQLIIRRLVVSFWCSTGSIGRGGRLWMRLLFFFFLKMHLCCERWREHLYMDVLPLCRGEPRLRCF